MGKKNSTMVKLPFETTISYGPKHTLLSLVFGQSQMRDRLRDIAEHLDKSIRADLKFLPAMVVSLASNQYSLDLTSETTALRHDVKAISLINHCLIEISNLHHRLYYLPKSQSCMTLVACQRLISKQQEILSDLSSIKESLSTLASLIDCQRGRVIGFELFISILGPIGSSQGKNEVLH